MKKFFFITFDFKNGCENEFKDNNEKHEADLEKRFFTKSMSNPVGRVTAMPKAWELRLFVIMLSYLQASGQL